MPTRPWMLLGLLLLAACESDVQKLGRLRREKEVAYAQMIAAQEGGNADSIRATEQRLLIVERELSDFLQNR